MKMIRRTGAVSLSNNFICLSVQLRESMIFINIPLWDTLKHPTLFNIYDMNVEEGLFYSYLVYL